MIEACCALSVETTRRTMISRIMSRLRCRLSVVDTWNSADSSDNRVRASSVSSSSSAISRRMLLSSRWRSAVNRQNTSTRPDSPTSE